MLTLLATAAALIVNAAWQGARGGHRLQGEHLGRMQSEVGITQEDSGSCGLVEEDMDYGAPDAPFSKASTPSQKMCCRACEMDSRCVAWSWGAEERSLSTAKVCLLKALSLGGRLRRTAHPGVVSGLPRKVMRGGRWRDLFHERFGGDHELQDPGDRWVSHRSRNCYHGSGAEKLEGGDDPISRNMSLVSCQVACALTSNCQGVVVHHDQRPTPCWLRRKINVDRCEHSGLYDLHVLVARDGPSSTPTPAPTAAPPSTEAASPTSAVSEAPSERPAPSSTSPALSPSVEPLALSSTSLAPLLAPAGDSDEDGDKAPCAHVEDTWHGDWGVDAAHRCRAWWANFEGWGASRSCGRCWNASDSFPRHNCAGTCCQYCGTGATKHNSTSSAPTASSMSTTSATSTDMITTATTSSWESTTTSTSHTTTETTTTPATSTTTLTTTQTTTRTISSTISTTSTDVCWSTLDTWDEDWGADAAGRCATWWTDGSWGANGSCARCTDKTQDGFGWEQCAGTCCTRCGTTTTTTMLDPRAHECAHVADTWTVKWGELPETRCSAWWTNSKWGAAGDCNHCLGLPEVFGTLKCAGTCCHHCGLVTATQLRFDGQSAGGLCVDASSASVVALAACSDEAWAHSSRGQLRSPDGRCLDAPSPGKAHSGLLTSPCDLDDWGQQWEYDEGMHMLKNRHGFCLDTSPEAVAAGGGEVFLDACDSERPWQRWRVRGEELSLGAGIVNRHSRLCVDSPQRTQPGGIVHMRPCGPTDPEQQWGYDAWKGLLRSHGGICLRAERPGRDGERLRMATCDNASWSQEWAYSSSDGQIKSRHGLCVSYEDSDLVMRACRLDDPKQRWSVREGPWLEATPAPPLRWPSPSFYCWAVAQRDSYELDLVKAQLSKKTGVFACEEYSAFVKGESIYLGEGPSGEETTTPLADLDVSGTMGNLSAPGQTTGSWLNTLTFLQVWATVHEQGLFSNHDWTVKADPDAVFMVDRLRSFLKPHTGEGANLYVRNSNCWVDSIELLGPLEVLSQAAVEVFHQGRESCSKKLPWHGWGEDYFLQHCLDMLLVGHVDNFDLLADAGCHPAPCTDASKVAYHPYKTVEKYENCLAQATR